MASSDRAPILSAEWTNDRFKVVVDAVYQLIDRLLDQVYAGGFGPLEEPITAADIKKLTAEAFQVAMEQQATIGAKAELIKAASKVE